MANTRGGAAGARRARLGRRLTPLRRHPHLFQINTWAWLERLSHALGREIKLTDVPDGEWDRLRDAGFDLVYLLGVWQRSPEGRRIFRSDPAAFRIFDQALPQWSLDAVVGSPFSIKSYVPDRRIGTWAQLDAVRAKLHERGMRLMLDFVSNHTGPDHVWIARYPQYFIQGSEADYRRNPAHFHYLERSGQAPLFIARGRDPYFAPWADTAQIDHFNPGARAALIDTLRTIAEHCDGLRCDMAMLALNDVFSRTWGELLGDRTLPEREFWSEAIAALPSEFVWMAEVYWDMETRLHGLGFEYTYDKRLYDRLHSGSAQEVRAHLGANIEHQARMVRFLENHDEARSVVAFGKPRLLGLVPLIATLPGLRFFHDGQFEGRRIHLPMPLNRIADEELDEDLAQIYATALDAANNTVFHDGAWMLLSVDAADDETHRNLIAYRWQAGDDYWLIVVNLSATDSRGRLSIAQELVAHEGYELVDVLNDAAYLRSRADLLAAGLYVRLHAFQAHLFKVSSR